MGISIRNAEGYYDPTAYDAMKIIEAEQRKETKFRPLVYICSPYAGEVDANVRNARKYCRFAVDKGFIPVAPHLLFPQFLDDSVPGERELGLFFGNILLSKCRELWFFGDRVSEGMAAEIEHAKKKKYIIRHFSSELKEEPYA